MNQALLKLSTEKLVELKKDVEEVLSMRMDMSLKRGVFATFVSSQHETITIVVERISAKSVSGHQIGGTHPGTRWRVGKGGITVVPRERKEPIVPPANPVKPKTMADTW